jgi:hypothetical protein
MLANFGGKVWYIFQTFNRLVWSNTVILFIHCSLNMSMHGFVPYKNIGLVYFNEALLEFVGHIFF